MTILEGVNEQVYLPQVRECACPRRGSDEDKDHSGHNDREDQSLAEEDSSASGQVPPMHKPGVPMPKGGGRSCLVARQARGHRALHPTSHRRTIALRERFT